MHNLVTLLFIRGNILGKWRGKYDSIIPKSIFYTSVLLNGVLPSFILKIVWWEKWLIFEHLLRSSLYLTIKQIANRGPRSVSCSFFFLSHHQFPNSQIRTIILPAPHKGEFLGCPPHPASPPPLSLPLSLLLSQYLSVFLFLLKQPCLPI